MKKFLIFCSLIIIIFGAGLAYRYLSPELSEKVYVAIEGESKIIAFDPATKQVVSEIDLSVAHEEGILPYAPHNVQVSPDMKTVWVTANSGQHQNHSFNLISKAYAHGEVGNGEDEVIVIDPKTDQIIKRLPIGLGLHLAHVALTPDSTYALVTAQNKGVIYKINTRTFEVEVTIAMSPLNNGLESPEPHGLRISPDGLTAYIAILKGESLGVLDLRSSTFSTVPLGGAAVQTGITPNGELVVASLYNTKQLAIYYPNTKVTKKIDLPSEAKGPIQMYPTPDSKFMYLADQGYYFSQPTSEWVYKIDLEKLEVVKSIKAGRAPHGVVVSEDGQWVYVTNLLSGDVSVISTVADREVGRIKVGKEPNGISIWLKN